MTKTSDLPGWERPDVLEDGLPVCFASLAGSWVVEHDSGVRSWIDNIGHRLWLPGMWGERIDRETAYANADRIVRHAVDALLALDGRLPDRRDTVWAGECETIARLMGEPSDEAPRLRRPAAPAVPGDLTVLLRTYRSPVTPAVASDMSALLRAYWLGRLHEINHRYDPEYDWATARTIGERYGLNADSLPSLSVEATRLLADQLTVPGKPEKQIRKAGNRT